MYEFSILHSCDSDVTCSISTNNILSAQTNVGYNQQLSKKNSATKIRLRSTVVWKGMEQAVQTIISWS